MTRAIWEVVETFPIAGSAKRYHEYRELHSTKEKAEAAFDRWGATASDRGVLRIVLNRLEVKSESVEGEKVFK